MKLRYSLKIANMPSNRIIDYINKNPKNFPLNFILLRPKPKKYSSEDIGRMIDLNKYQSKAIIVDFFYKKISRII